MVKKIGFIGCGNMGKAILKGLIKSCQFSEKNIWVYTPSVENKNQIGKKYGVKIGESPQQVVELADLIFSVVKPQTTITMLTSIANSLRKESILVSIAAGITISQIAHALGHNKKIVRAMPNLPVLVNAGMTAITPNNLVTLTEINEIIKIFKSLGETEIVPENMMHSVVGVSGSTPAFVFMFIESIADAAVQSGMSRAQAYRFAAQSIEGSSKMVKETNKHPSILKDMVCSPSGTTIEAVRLLEKSGFRSSVIEATRACIKRSRQISEL